MPVERYRSVNAMPRPWRAPDDPGNLRAVALMLALYRRLKPPTATPQPAVQRFRTLEAANAARNDPYRLENPILTDRIAPD